MTRPRLLDLFCGAGGAAMGYHRAGFDVVGVDIVEQPRYPFEFYRADTFDVLETLLFLGWQPDSAGPFLIGDFDAIHASPLCKAHTALARLWPDREWPDQITPLRPLLEATGLPWVVENVEGAPLNDPVRLCGSMFDPPLDVRRHRLFETGGPAGPWLPEHHWPCRHRLWAPRRFPAEHRSNKGAAVIGVYGRGRYAGSERLREAAMQIDWMRRDELTQAIPPAYTEWIGAQLLEHLGATT